ncbi:DNA topoisomerase I, partial [Candidatus Bathyarchaeota archaeon]|nr:DNA topoisomerase I [Candidatus Bathyarchaeota archaeon]
MVILIIAEKKSAALQLANALDYSGKPREIKINSGVSYIEIQLFGTREKAFIASAAGHLYKLEAKGKRGASPVFDFHWVQNKQNKYIYKYIKTIKDIISKTHVSEYIIATDLDLEGSVIGFNIVKFTCLKGKSSVKRVRDNSSRMEFSTLTKQEIRKAWQGRKKGLDCNRIKAGYARHWVDILFGINLSKALTDAVKSVSGRFQIFSMGRVQGPTLKAVYERDEKIENHVPKKYWELDVIGKTTNKTISLAHI